jgi:hypothetical protein
MEDLIDCGATYISGALHHRIFLSTDASAHLLSEIARSAHRRGLIYYDPQSDTLNLPSSETHNPVESNKQAMIPDGPAITIIYGPWTVLAYSDATRRCYTQIGQSGSDLCGCANCKNFVLARDRAYPPEVLVSRLAWYRLREGKRSTSLWAENRGATHLQRLVLLGWLYRGRAGILAQATEE